MSERVKLIEQRLRAAFAPQSLKIVDESAHHAGHLGARSGGGHYAITIVSPRFAGRSAVKRHRMVYEALGELMQKEIHALSINASAPEER